MYLHPAHCDAYHLARTLLAGVYAATPAAVSENDPDGPLHRLRCAVVSSASLLLNLAVVGSGLATSSGAATGSGADSDDRQLQDARAALAAVATALAECHRHGHLAGTWYETLYDHQRRAAAALEAPASQRPAGSPAAAGRETPAQE